MKKSKWKKTVSILMASLMLLTMFEFSQGVEVHAASNAEIQNKILSLLYKGGGRMTCDFDGYVTTAGRHEGIDFANAAGHAVYAILDGEVTAVRGGNGSLSTVAVYNSAYNVTIIYLHTSDFKVIAGQNINIGTQIACESNQGTTAAHTHVELRPGRQMYASVSSDSVLSNPNPYSYYNNIYFGDNPPTPTPGPDNNDIVRWENEGVTKDGFSLYWNFSNCNSVVVSITSIAKNQVVGSLTLPNNYTYNFKVGDSSWGREFEVKLIPDGNTDRPHYVRFGDKENRVILPEPDPTPTQEVVSWENAGVTSAGFTVHFWFPNCKDVVVTITSKALNQVVGSLTLPNDSTYHFGVENLNWGREYEVKLAPDGDNNRAHYVRNGNVENQVTLPEPANIEEGTYRINSRVGAKNSYVSVDTSSGKEGANVRLWENTTGAAYQKWIFTYLETNKYGQKIYSIRSSWSGYALEVENLAEEYGSNVKTGKYTGKDSQKWILEKRGDYYYIISLNGTFLDVVNGNDANGTNVQTQVGRKDNAAQVYKVTSDQPASTTAPTVSNVQITNISKDGYTVMCDATDDLGIRNVEFSSWTSRNGQDDIVTADGKISGDSVWYRVNTSDHNSEKGGVYNTKISANDIDGHTTEYTVTVYVPANNPLYTVECKEADDRKTVDVKVSVKNLTEIYSGNFDLIYDNERLQPESYSFSGSLNESIADCDLNYGGFGNTVSVSFSDDEALEQTGVVTVTFAVLGDGNTTFPITNANAFNENGDAVDVETEEGSINIVTGQVPVGENDPQIVIDKKTARAGDTVQLAIVLKNAEALKSIALSNIAYDTEHLELTEGKWLTENGTLSDVNLEKKVAAIGFANNTDCNGEIFLFTFTVKEGTADAVYPVSCNITAKRMVGEDEVPYTVASVSGSIEVVSVKKGDTNGDNKITSDDAIYLLYHTLLPSMYPINQKADFNGDGKVTSDDAIYLLYHTLLPSMYPLT